MVFDSIENIDKGPFCKPYGQLFYDNLEKMPAKEAFIRGSRRIEHGV